MRSQSRSAVGFLEISSAILNGVILSLKGNDKLLAQKIFIKYVSLYLQMALNHYNQGGLALKGLTLEELWKPVRSQWMFSKCYLDGLVQDCSNSSVLAMELLQSCTKPKSQYKWPLTVCESRSLLIEKKIDGLMQKLSALIMESHFFCIKPSDNSIVYLKQVMWWNQSFQVRLQDSFQQIC